MATRTVKKCSTTTDYLLPILHYRYRTVSTCLYRCVHTVILSNLFQVNGILYRTREHKKPLFFSHKKNNLSFSNSHTQIFCQRKKIQNVYGMVINSFKLVIV